MNSSDNTNTLRYNFSAMTDNQIKSMYAYSEWNSLNSNERLSLLQETANRYTNYEGIPKCKVAFDENMRPTTYGTQSGDTIYLNSQLFTEDKLYVRYVDTVNDVSGDMNGCSQPDIEFNPGFTNYLAYETLLHELRHVYQDCIADGTITVNNDRLTEECKANTTETIMLDGYPASKYLSSGNYWFYYLNPTEIDARFASENAACDLALEHIEANSYDSAAVAYIENIKQNGCEATLNEIRCDFGNDHVDNDVADILIKINNDPTAPATTELEKAVRNDMIQTCTNRRSMSEKGEKNMETTEDNGFSYSVSDNGSVTARGTAQNNPASRNGMSSIHPNDYNSAYDDKGHLIAAREGGMAKEENIFTMNRSLNRGEYKTVENAEVRLAEQNNTVEVEKTAYVSNPGAKPDAFMVNDTITTPEGRTQTVHLSFQNTTKSEQETWDAIAAQNTDYDAFSNPNSARESMTESEYNDIMEQTEGYSSNVRDEFDIENSFSFDQTFDSQEATSDQDYSADTESESQSCDNSCDNDCSCDDSMGIE